MADKHFIHDDFLLSSDTARQLYHDYAAEMPIIDYHCHLLPEEISQDKHWETITELWLGGDHYKWRAMRSNGINEEIITGPAGDWEKFSAWANTMPKLLGNPLYHWNQLELARYFDVFELLSSGTSKDIYDRCNSRLGPEGLSSRSLIKESKVVAICTTDDPCDSLVHHEFLSKDNSIECKVLPAWRPDKAMMPENGEAFNGGSINCQQFQILIYQNLMILLRLYYPGISSFMTEVVACLTMGLKLSMQKNIRSEIFLLFLKRRVEELSSVQMKLISLNRTCFIFLE